MKNFYFLIFSILFLTACNPRLKNVVTSDSIENLNQLIAEAKPGTTIKLQNRIYKPNEMIKIFDKENLTIDGNGAKIILTNLASDVIFIDNSSQISIKNLSAKHIEPSGPIGCTGNVIHVENSSEVTIEKSDLNGSGIVGIAAYNTDNLKVVKNHIHKNSDYAIIYMGPSISLTKNTFENNGNGNAIWFSNIEKGGTIGWPPEEKIFSDQNKPGLTMSGNVFKGSSKK